MPDAAKVTPFPTETEAAAAEVTAKEAKVAAKEAAAPVEGQKPIREISELSEKQQAEWKLTGKHPDLEPAAAPANKKDSTDPGDDDGEETKSPPDSKSPRRLHYGELRARVRELEAKLAEREAKKADAGEVAAPPPRADEPPAPKVDKLRPRPEPDGQNADGTPKYKIWREYEDDLLAWNDEKRDIAAASKAAEVAKVNEITNANKAIEDAWWSRVDEARKLYPDFDQSIDDEAGIGKEIQAGSLLDGWIMNSELGAKVFYYLHKNRDYFKTLKVMSPIKASRALSKLEEELEGVGESAAPPPKPADKTRVTHAPPPGRTVSGRGSTPVDEVSKAVADDDVRAYIHAANRRHLESLKGR